MQLIHCLLFGASSLLYLRLFRNMRATRTSQASSYVKHVKELPETLCALFGLCIYTCALKWKYLKVFSVRNRVLCCLAKERKSSQWKCLLCNSLIHEWHVIYLGQMYFVLTCCPPRLVPKAFPDCKCQKLEPGQPWDQVCHPPATRWLMLPTLSLSLLLFHVQ